MLSLAQFQWRVVKTPLTFRWPSLDFLLNSDKISSFSANFKFMRKIKKESKVNGGVEKIIIL